MWLTFYLESTLEKNLLPGMNFANLTSLGASLVFAEKNVSLGRAFIALQLKEKSSVEEMQNFAKTFLDTASVGFKAILNT